MFRLGWFFVYALILRMPPVAYFMLSGLAEVEHALAEKNIPFYFLQGRPEKEIDTFIHEKEIGALITDFSPLRYNRIWKESLLHHVTVPFSEVDAHNIVPVWVASSKQEYGAYTLRPKIHRLLPEYLTAFPLLKTQEHEWGESVKQVDWKSVRSVMKEDTTVLPVTWLSSGEKAADTALTEFINVKLETYDQDRNDPTRHAQSDLSPYIHFGQLSTQRIALEIDHAAVSSLSKNAFLEEVIVRKELSDNFCFYNPDYDSTKGFPAWAKKTLHKHRRDIRPYTYTVQELENGKTHDDLWNGAQQELRIRGKMHGYLRMYWAKKIYEWSSTPEEALKHTIYLNDKYFLDGRDPNGYVGIAWSIGGVHDRAWFEREIFGKIRYMSYNGAKSKFSIKEYIDYVRALS
jgi:deoxyribodipyrimidine photo-lyase